MADDKKVKFINVEGLEHELRYPVGRNLAQNFERIQTMAESLMEQLTHHELKRRINFVCRGSSGAICAALVSQVLASKDVSITVSHVKKEGESSHASAINLEKYDVIVFIDDFISSGSTMNQMLRGAKAYWGYGEDSFKVHYLLTTGIVELARLEFEPDVVITGTGYY